MSAVEEVKKSRSHEGVYHSGCIYQHIANINKWIDETYEW